MHPLLRDSEGSGESARFTYNTFDRRCASNETSLTVVSSEIWSNLVLTCSQSDVSVSTSMMAIDTFSLSLSARNLGNERKLVCSGNFQMPELLSRADNPVMQPPSARLSWLSFRKSSSVVDMQSH